MIAELGIAMEVTRMKKDRGFVFNILFGWLLLLGCLSCGETKYRYGNKLYSRTELLARDKQESDAMLSQITPTGAPIGGSLVVFIPTDEFLIQTFSTADKGNRPDIMHDWADLQLQLLKNQLISMIEALRKRALFEKLDWRQSVDPEQEAFEVDFGLIWPAKKDTEWLLRTRTQAIHEATPVARGPSSLSRLQWVTIWLNNIEEAAREAKEQ